MTFLLSKTFWAASAERAIKTFAQALLAWVTADTFDVLSPDWKSFLAVVLVPTFASVLTSVGSGVAPMGRENSPSLTKEE